MIVSLSAALCSRVTELHFRCQSIPACGQESADDDHMDVTEKSEMLDKIIYVNRKNAPIKLRLESVSNVLDFTDISA